MATNTERITALESWKAQHVKDHAAGVIHKHDPAPTPSGIPPIPAGRGTLFRKDFADGALAPFVVQTYNNDHPGQEMTKFTRYVNDAAHVSVHDGYLDLLCNRNPAQPDANAADAFLGVLLATYQQPGAWPPPFTAGMGLGYTEVCARFPSPTGGGDWRGLWLYDPGSSEEIDIVERINGQETATYRPGAIRFMSLPLVDGNWHRWGLRRETGKTTVYLDGVQKGTIAQGTSTRQAYSIDTKVGLVATTAGTPTEMRTHVAWWVTD